MRRHQHEPTRCTIPSRALLLFVFLAVSSGVTAAEESPAASGDGSPRPGPVDAETAVTRFELPDDLRIELVAAEPDVIDPVAMAFDAEGRLWVVEMSDYPNGPPEDGPPLSRVRVLTDADGDGRYTDPVTFADKLLFANGLLLWNGGLLVTSEGEVLFLRDTDGDGEADERDVWFTGFKRDNPQLRANHPTLALDNHIYVASGLRGGDVIAARDVWATDAKPVSLSGRDFRFDPLTGAYQAVSGVGQFGLCFDNFGNRFVCSNRNPCSHIVLEDRYLARNPNLGVSRVHEDVSPPGEQSRLYPISRIWTTSNLHANQFTAACGLLIYRGGALPEPYHGNSFTCEPTSNLVHRDVLTPRGATFASRPGREGVEFLATKDEWFRPVNLTHGPDGALYVADMYRAVIEHPQWMPVELRTRSDLWDGQDRGRIYRIVPRETTAATGTPQRKLSPLTAEELVGHLASANPWERDTAARLLLERQEQSVAGPLATLAETGTLAASRVQALWLLEGMGVLSREMVATALKDPQPRVREQALLLAERRFADDESFGDRCREILVDPDSDGRLVFQAALSMGAFPASEATPVALADVAARFPQDRWLRAAVASSAAGTMPEVLVHVVKRWDTGTSPAATSATALGMQLALIEQYAEIVASGGDADATTPLFALLPSGPSATDADVLNRQRRSFALLRGIAKGLRRSGGRLERSVAKMEEPSKQLVASAFAASQSLAADSSQSVGVRVEAIKLLAEAPSDDAMPVLPSLLSGSEDQEITLAAIEALSRQGDPQVGVVLLEGFRQRTPRFRNAILAAITTPDRIRLLLDEIEAGRISQYDINPTLAQRLSRLSDKDLKARANKLLASQANTDRQEVIGRYQAAVTLPSDLERGRAVFAKTCATCHRVGDVGVNVGADISDTRAKTPAQLLMNILDPNKVVDGNYFGYSLIDAEGRVHTGIITAETASSVTLRQPEGKDATFLRRDIEELASTGLSLMPVGLEKNVDVQQMADLISYLKNWRYLDGSVPRDVIGGKSQ